MNASSERCSSCGQTIAAAIGGDFCAACLIEDAVLPQPLESFGLDSEHAGTVQSFGEYELIEEIGRGGMGVIYKARHSGLDRVVALKMLLAGEFADRKSRGQLLREARAAARLAHPNIVTVHEVGEHDGRAFLAMEYVPGPNLAEAARRSVLPVATVARYLEQLARAVHFAHQNGIVHRDLKPANILLAWHDTPKITDFGLNKSAFDASQTLGSAGSPNFMAPEQADGRTGRTGTHTDVFGLGGTLYYLLTGRPPFSGETLTETLHAVVALEPVAPRALRPAIPGDLETICLKCLEKDPKNRYATAEALALDLQRFLAREPIQARPPSASDKLRKWVLRNKPAAIALAAIAAAIVTGFAVCLHFLSKETKARAQAETLRALTEQSRTETLRALYAANLNTVQQALNEGDFGRARQLLDRWRPSARDPVAGTNDFRHWEWRYLWNQAKGDIKAVVAAGHSPAMSMAFSADGTLLAAGWASGLVKVITFPGLSEVKTIQSNGPPASVCWAPSGSLLAFGGARQTIHLHDLASGKSRLIAGNEEGTVRDLRFSRDGKWISGIRYGALSLEIDPGAGGPGQAVLLRVSDGQELLRTQGDWMNTWSSGCAAISPNQEVFWTLLSMNTPTNVQNGSVLLKATDIRTGEVLFEKNDFNGSARASALAISPDGHWVAVGCGYKDGTVYIIDAQHQQFVTRLTGQTKWIGGLSFTKDSSLLFSGSADQSVFVWETATWKRKQVLRGAGNEIWPVAATPDADSVAVGDKNGTIFLLDLKRDGTRQPFVSFPASEAFHLRPRLDSGTIWKIPKQDRDAAGEIDLATGEVRPLGLPPNTGFFSRNWLDSYLLMANQENECSIYQSVPAAPNASPPSHRSFKPLFGPPGPKIAGAVSVNFHESGIIGWITASSAHFSDLNTGKEWTLPNDCTRPTRFQFMAQGKLFLIGADWTNFVVRDIHSGAVLIELPGNPKTYYGSVNTSSDGRYLFWSENTASGSNLCLWDSFTPHDPPRKAATDVKAVCPVFSADDQWLAHGSPDGPTVIWQVHPLRELGRVTGAMGSFFPAFSADRQRLVSTSGGKGAIKLWATKDWLEMLSLDADGAVFQDAAFTPDQRWLIATTQYHDGIKAWYAPSWEEIAAIERHLRGWH